MLVYLKKVQKACHFENWGTTETWCRRRRNLVLKEEHFTRYRTKTKCFVEPHIQNHAYYDDGKGLKRPVRKGKKMNSNNLMQKWELVTN